MSTPFESLDDTFNISSEIEATFEAEPVSGEIVPAEETKPEKVKPKTDKEEDREKDYQYARGQLYSIIEKMQETLNDAMEVASESDHPRAFEVTFAGAKHLADVVDKLQDLHKKNKSMDAEQPSETKLQQNNTQNIFMTGTTNDLMKMLKDSQNKDK